MKLLYITRKYPPMVGGMEKLSYGLASAFKQNTDTTLITWGRSQKFLPIVIPYFFLKALFIIPIKKIDHLHIGDALLSPLGLILKIIFKLKTSINVNGLDVIFNFRPYQYIVPKCLNKLDLIISNSRATKEECIKRGIPGVKIIVIPPGIDPNEFKINTNRNELEKVINKNTNGKKIFVTVGRLVKRKGVAWFIENVLPKLNKNVFYLVIGEGEDRDLIVEKITKYNLQDRVLMLGKISDEKLKVIYNTSDIFIMPNFEVKDTMEGFGIVAVEASSTGLPIVASNIEGIRDSVIDGKTGILAEPLSPQSFINSIYKALKLTKQEIIKTTVQKFSWPEIGKKYFFEISDLYKQ